MVAPWPKQSEKARATQFVFSLEFDPTLIGEWRWFEGFKDVLCGMSSDAYTNRRSQRQERDSMPKSCHVSIKGIIKLFCIPSESSKLRWLHINISISTSLVMISLDRSAYHVSVKDNNKQQTAHAVNHQQGWIRKWINVRRLRENVRLLNQM